jgi:hypothetical protein
MDVQIILNKEAVDEIRNRNRLAHGGAYTEQHYGPTFTGPYFKDVLACDLSEGFMTVRVRDGEGHAVYHYNCADIRRIKEIHPE